MISALHVQFLLALIAISLLTVKTATVEDEGLACIDMAVALAKLQTLTGTPQTPHIAVTPHLQTKDIH